MKPIFYLILLGIIHMTQTRIHPLPTNIDEFSCHVRNATLVCKPCELVQEASCGERGKFFDEPLNCDCEPICLCDYGFIRQYATQYDAPCIPFEECPKEG